MVHVQYFPMVHDTHPTSLCGERCFPSPALGISNLGLLKWTWNIQRTHSRRILETFSMGGNCARISIYIYMCVCVVSCHVMSCHIISYHIISCMYVCMCEIIYNTVSLIIFIFTSITPRNTNDSTVLLYCVVFSLPRLVQGSTSSVAMRKPQPVCLMDINGMKRIKMLEKMI